MENKTDLIERLRKIANELEQDLKPEFEVGKWYYTKVGSLYYIESINGNKCYGYGLRYDNEWKNGEVCFVENIKRLATESVVLEALTKEAVKLGLVKGCTIESSNGKKYSNNNNDYGISSSNSNVFLLCNYPIMEYGIWATVIKEKTSDELIDELEIHAVRAVKSWFKANNLIITKKPT